MGLLFYIVVDFCAEKLGEGFEVLTTRYNRRKAWRNIENEEVERRSTVER
jgi:hypothetical protein